MRDLGSSGKAHWSPRAGFVKCEAFVGGASAADMLFRQEAKWAAADDFGDRLERRGRRQTLRHDGGDVGSWSRQGLRQMRKRPLQTEPHGAIVGRRQLLGCGHQRIGEADASGKAADAGDDVAC